MSANLNRCRKCERSAVIFWVADNTYRWCKLHEPDTNWEESDDE